MVSGKVNSKAVFLSWINFLGHSRVGRVAEGGVARGKSLCFQNDPGFTSPRPPDRVLS